eukprot:1160420-Pelagomonas_calceolata.AAC.4
MKSTVCHQKSCFYNNCSKVKTPIMYTYQPADLEGSTLYKLGLNSIVPRSAQQKGSLYCTHTYGSI